MAKFKELDKVIVMRKGDIQGKEGIVMHVHADWQGLHGPYEIRLYDSNNSFPRYLMREDEIDYPKNALQRLKEKYEN